MDYFENYNSHAEQFNGKLMNNRDQFNGKRMNNRDQFNGKRMNNRDQFNGKRNQFNRKGISNRDQFNRTNNDSPFESFRKSKKPVKKRITFKMKVTNAANRFKSGDYKSENEYNMALQHFYDNVSSLL